MIHFEISVLHVTAFAYFIVETEDLTTFTITLKSYKSYQQSALDRLVIRKLKDEPIIIGKYNTGKTKTIWEIVECSHLEKESLIKELTKEVELWVKDNVVIWKPE